MQKKEFAVLTLLEQSEEALTQRQITAELGFSVGSVNKIVKKLTDEGLIANGRITPAGVEALEPYRVKRAIFLAAGFGSRMVPLTFNTPKPLVRVHGTRMIDTLLDAVVAAGIPEIVIVRGYLGEQFDQLLYKYPMIKFMENPILQRGKQHFLCPCCPLLDAECLCAGSGPGAFQSQADP